MIEEANDKFAATMTNVVRWRDAAQPQHPGDASSSNGSSSGNPAGKEICSETSIQVVLEVPGWFIVPVAAIEKTGAQQPRTASSFALPAYFTKLCWWELGALST